MDALQLLQNDHDKVNKLFEQFERGGNPQEFKQLFEMLNQELTLHAIIEEQVFYPMVRQYPELENLVKNAYEEHGEAKMLLNEIASVPNTSNEWGSKMTSLMQAIRQHVREEEGVLFVQLRQMLGQEQLDQLGQKLMQAKQQPFPLVNQNQSMNQNTMEGGNAFA